MIKKKRTFWQGRQTLFFGISYFALIFIFAGIYTFFPFEFYHTTIQYEKSSFEYEKAKILEGIENAIIKNCIANGVGGSDNSIDCGIGYFSLNSIELEGLDIENELCTFNLIFYLYSLDGSFYYPVLTQFTLFDAPNIEFIYEAISGKKRFFKRIQYDKPEIPQGDFALEGEISIDKLFPQEMYKKELRETNFVANAYNAAVLFSEIEKIEKTSNIVLLEFTENLDRRFFYFRKGIKGFPSELKNNFLRMLYFSSVTITTLGYGDIVPITNATRIVVTLETILGMLFIGLFLNSLANKISSKKDENREIMPVSRAVIRTKVGRTFFQRRKTVEVREYSLGWKRPKEIVLCARCIGYNKSDKKV